MLVSVRMRRRSLIHILAPKSLGGNPGSGQRSGREACDQRFHAGNPLLPNRTQLQFQRFIDGKIERFVRHEYLPIKMSADDDGHSIHLLQGVHAPRVGSLPRPYRAGARLIGAKTPTD